MAKKSSRSGSKKHYAVQNKIRVANQTPGLGNSTLVARCDRIASIANHRLYRQSRYYNASVSLDANVTAGSTVSVYVLRDTWMLQKAYQKAKEVLDENHDEEMMRVGEANSARWNDFRVDHGLTNVTEVYPWIESVGAVTAGPLVAGQYLMSEVGDSAGNIKKFQFQGAGTDFNIITEYDKMGNTDSSPQSALSSAGYDGLEDDVDSNIVNHISTDGSLPPYDWANISGNVWTRVATLTANAAGVQKLSTGTFTAPAGLIVFVLGGGLTDVNAGDVLTIDLKLGDYKGLHAPSMLEWCAWTQLL
jgi:hypothetical protein